MNIKENIYANENLTKSQEDVINVINSQGLETFFHTSTYGSEVTPNTEGGYGGYAHQMAIRGLEKRGIITAQHMWRGATCRLNLNKQ